MDGEKRERDGWREGGSRVDGCMEAGGGGDA
jgi:hypothetical protein